MSNDLRSYDWDALIYSLASRLGSEFQFALQCAFVHSAALYAGQYATVMSDPAIREIVRSRMEALAALDFSYDEAALEPFLIGVVDSPFPEIHDDVDIYESSMYALTSRGVDMAPLPRKRERGGKETRRLWDGGGTALQAGFDNLAIAALDDGLFELPIDKDSLAVSRQPEQRGTEHATYVNWVKSSIYASSDRDGGYLAQFDPGRKGRRPEERRFVEVVDAESIFSGKGQSWGGSDRLYSLRGSTLEVVKFDERQGGTRTNGTKLERENPFERLPKQESGDAAVGRVIRGSASHFGAVVESMDSLTILPSIGEPLLEAGPITRWRLFPRSIRYTNQLHVVNGEHIDILSFNHDTFQDQATKIIGSAHSAPVVPKRLRGIRGESSEADDDYWDGD